jgi:hypothetical protein
MRRAFRVAILAVASTTVISCAANSTAHTATSHRTAGVITGDEISAAQGVVSVYDAIQRLRPQWLTNSRARSVGTQDQLLVYIDTNRYGTIESVRQLPIGGVTELRYLNAAEATNRFGTGHAGGVIVVMMSRP